MPARRLPDGARYTALGQFDTDVEYFVAAPAATPRHTLRYGGTYRRVPEFQDLLHLELPGDGAYFVALYPRPRSEAAPQFETLAGGLVIRTSGAFGTDYAFLSPEAATAEAAGVAFAGTAAAVQERGGGRVLTLGAVGEVRAGGYGLTAPGAASLAVAGDALALTLPATGAGGELTIAAPGRWTAAPVEGVEVQPAEGGLRVKVPAGAARVTFAKAD
jgi:hypothetical protein